MSPQSVNIGPIYLHLANLPSKYTWQDLKDLIHKTAVHGIWTDISQPVGHVRIQLRSEADRTYKALTATSLDGRRLLIVHYWDIGSQTPSLQKSNCHLCSNQNKTRNPESFKAHMLHMNNFLSGGALPFARPLEIPPPGRLPSLPFRPITVPNYAVQTSPTAIAYARPTSIQLSVQYGYAFQEPMGTPRRRREAEPTPQYTQPLGTGMPVNTANGTVRTETRGVFVSGLPYKASSDEVKKLFSRAGDIKTDRIPADARGRLKGTATIEYHSAYDAQTAIKMFDQARPFRAFRDSKLTVRKDKEQTVIRPPSKQHQPVIVNGSQVG